MNFKYSQSSNNPSNRQDYPNLHFVGNKISLRQQNRYHPPPEDYQLHSYFPSNQSNLYHGHSEDVSRNHSHQVHVVKRESTHDNRQQLSKSSSSDTFYGTEKGPFWPNNQYQISSPVNFTVSAGGPFYSEKQMPKVTLLTRKPSQSNLNQNVQMVSSPTNVKYTQQTQQSPAYVQILHQQAVSPLRQQQGRVITFSPGQQITSPQESMGMNQIDTSRIKQGSQNDVQNSNHVSMFSISSTGMGNKGNGSEVSTSRVLQQQGYEQSQLMSNVSNASNSMNPSSMNMSNQQMTQQNVPTQVIHYPNTFSNNTKPYQVSTQSVPKQGPQQNANSSSQLTYGSSMFNNASKPGTNRSINTQNYNYTPLLTKATNNQLNQANQNNNSSSNNTSISQGLSFQQRSVNKLHKQSAMNYKQQLNMSGSSGVNAMSNQSGQVIIKGGKGLEKEKAAYNKTLSQGSEQSGIELKYMPTPASFTTSLTSPKHHSHSNQIDTEQTQPIHDHKYSSTGQQDFITNNNHFSSTSNEYDLRDHKFSSTSNEYDLKEYKFSSTSNEYYLREYDKRERKNNLKEIIRNEGIVDKLEEKINGYEVQICNKNDEISRLKKDSSEKALEIINLNRELQKYRTYEKTLSFKQRQAKSLSFHHNQHSDYSSSHRSIQQSSKNLSSQSPKSIKPSNGLSFQSSKRTVNQQLSNIQYTSRGSKTTSNPTVQSYNHIQNLNEKLLQQIEKMEKQLKPLRQQVRGFMQSQKLLMQKENSLKQRENSYIYRENQYIQEKERLLRENIQWRNNFRRVQVSNTQIDRTMKLILSDKIDLQKRLQELNTKTNTNKTQLTNLQLLKSQLVTKNKQQQQRINQLSNELITKQQYIIYLSQQKSTLSQSNQNQSHQLLLQIQDQKDTINVLKKVNDKQKSVIETDKDKLKEKDTLITKLNQEIKSLTGENQRIMQEFTCRDKANKISMEQAIKCKQQLISELQLKVKQLQLRVKQLTNKQNQLVSRQRQLTNKQNQLIGRQKESLSRQKLLQQKLSKLQSSTFNNQKLNQQLYKLNQSNNQLLIAKRNNQLQLKSLKEQHNKQLQELTQKAKQILQLKQQNKLIDQKSIEVLHKNQHLLLEVNRLKAQNHQLRKQTQNYLKSNQLETSGFSDELKKMKDQNLTYQQQINNLTNTINHLNDQVAQLKNNNINQITNIQSLTSQIDSLNSQTSQLTLKLDQQSTKSQSLQSDIQYHLLTIKQLKQELTEKDKWINQKQILTSKQEKEIFQLKNHHITLTSTITTLKDSLNSLTQSQTSQHSQKTHLVEHYSQQLALLTKLLQTKNQQISQNHKKLLALNKEHKSTIQLLEQKIQQLQKKLELTKQQYQLTIMKSNSQTNLQQQKNLQNQLNQDKVKQLITKITELQKQQTLLNKETTKLVKDKQANINKSKQQITKMKNQHEQRLQVIKKSHKQQLDSKSKLMQKMETQLMAIKQKIQSSKQTQKQQQKSTNVKIQQLYKENQSLNKKNAQLLKENQSLNKKNAQLLKENQFLNKKNAQLLKENQSLNKKNAQLLKENQSLSKKYKQLQKQITKVSSANNSSSSFKKIQSPVKKEDNTGSQTSIGSTGNTTTNSSSKKAQTVTQLSSSIEQKIKQMTTLKKQLTQQKQSLKISEQKSKSLQQSSKQLMSSITSVKKQNSKLILLNQQLKQTIDENQQLNQKLKRTIDQNQLTISELSSRVNALEQFKTKQVQEEVQKQSEMIVLKDSIELLNKQLTIYEQKYHQQQQKQQHKLEQQSLEQKHIQSAQLIQQNAGQQQQPTQQYGPSQELVDQSLQDDKPLSPSTTQQKLPQSTHQPIPQTQLQHSHQQLTQQQLQQMILSLKHQTQQLQDKQDMLNQRELQLAHKQQLLEDRALQIQEKEIQVEELYGQVKEQIQQLRNQFYDQSDELQTQTHQQFNNQLDKHDYQQSYPSQSLTLNNLQQQQQIQQHQQQIEFIQIDKNALIYICQLLTIPPIEGQLLTTIIAQIQTIAPKLLQINQIQAIDPKLLQINDNNHYLKSNQPIYSSNSTNNNCTSSNKKSAIKSPKSTTNNSVIMKSDRKKPTNKQLVKIITDFQALHDSILLGSDQDQSITYPNNSKNIDKSKSPKNTDHKKANPQNNPKSPTNKNRDRTLSKQSNNPIQQQLLSSRSLQHIDQTSYINSSQLINKSQIFSEKLIPQLQQQYIQILQLFQVSPEKNNHHQLLINQIVNIKETIKMLLEEVKKAQGERASLERELKDQRKRIGVIIQESGKEIVKVNKDMVKLQLQKDSLTIVNAKLQQEIHFITHQLLSSRIYSMVYLNPQKYKHQEQTIKINQIKQTLQSLQNQQQQHLNQLKEPYVSISNLTDTNNQANVSQNKEHTIKRQRKSSLNSAKQPNNTLNLPKLKPKVKSQNDLSDNSQKSMKSKKSYKSIKQQKTSTVKDKSKKTTQFSQIKGKKQTKSPNKPQLTQKQQETIQETHSVDEQINMISEINAQELNIYRNIIKRQDTIEQNYQILHQLNQQSQTDQKEHHTDSQDYIQDQKYEEEQWYELKENKNQI